MRLGDCGKTNLHTYSDKEKWSLIRYLDTGSITEGRIDEIQTLYPGVDKIPSRARRKASVGDILFSTVRPNQKHYGIIEAGTENLLVSTGFTVVTVDTTIADPYFIYYYLTQSSVIESLQAIAEQSTSTYPSIKPSDIEDIELDLPELETQKKIGSTLRMLDRKIALNEEINDNLLAQAQAIFMQRFIMDEIEGDEKPLYDFADYINGAAFKPSECGDHGLPIIKIAELKNGITDSTKWFDGFKGEKYLIQDKDILFSWSGNPDTSIDIFIWTHGKAILNQHTFNVKSNTGHRWFTFLMLKYFKPEFSRIASNKQTTGLGHVTITDLKRLTFVFNEDAIESFEHEVRPFMETIYFNMMESQRLEQLRDNLLPKLMSGEIDVSDIQL